MKILLKKALSSRTHVPHNILLHSKGLSTSLAWTLHPLKSRGLVELKGSDVKPFLQGLITNDVNVLGTECTSLYTMLLNVQGRVLYDLLAYQKVLEDGNPIVLLEHDRHVTSDLIKLLKRYKIRKQVDIADISNNIKVFAALPPSGAAGDECLSMDYTSLYLTDLDPRIQTFGRRILSASDDNIKQCVHKASELVLSSEDSYHEARYKLGISEGITDLPPGNCFPLESNLVYLNGVCFHKGCYIGQELTARTFHTGVTRKRLMPLEFESVPNGLSSGEDIVNENGKSVGKFRNSFGKYGLGLMRIAELSGSLSVSNQQGQKYSITTNPPPWWPKDDEKGYL